MRFLRIPCSLQKIPCRLQKNSLFRTSSRRHKRKKTRGYDLLPSRSAKIPCSQGISPRAPSVLRQRRAPPHGGGAVAAADVVDRLLDVARPGEEGRQIGGGAVDQPVRADPDQ